MIIDFLFILQWWFLFLILGFVFLPLTTIIFSSFFDKGYIFSKILGVAFISYAVFVLGILKLLPFTLSTIFLVAGFFVGINIFVLKRYLKPTMKQLNNETMCIFLFEELLFLLALTFWSYIRGFQPDIHGLEKYMDLGFINSILRSEYFPPKDMWFTPFSINYYYFGHIVAAVLTKLSLLSSSFTFNLMIATIFAFTFTCSFSIGANLIYLLKSQISTTKQKNKQFENLKNWNLFGIWNLEFGILAGGLLTAFLVTFAGNLHTVYTFFKPYTNENPVPFWQLVFSPQTFPNSYWYPNATRFIHNTIHEFPMYSFVVSDLHGHVLDIPLVLLTIAVLLSLITKSQITNHKSQINSKFQNSKSFGILSFGYWNIIWNLEFGIWNLLLMNFLLAIMYMTNAWDGIIYALLTLFIFFYLAYRSKNYTLYAIRYILILGGLLLFSLPFSLHFKPFVSGIGVLCAPEFLTKIGHFGPLLFEPDHCQQSPWWQLLILYGFFYFWAILFIVFILRERPKAESRSILESFSSRRSLSRLRGSNHIYPSDIFVLVLISLSTLLIIIPEFIYAKDIYPAHYRANTMFKLVYQAFVMLSLSSGYIMMRIVISDKQKAIRKIFLTPYWLLVAFLLLLVAMYPYFAITSYYGNLSTYYGLDGTSYLKRQYPTDYDAISWLNKNVSGQPIILEAQGDSYTDFGRVATHTGLPTLLGWTVHEWLWRGTYDIPSPRINEIKTLYESNDLIAVKELINKYHVSLIFIGDLERQKYSLLHEEKFQSLGKLIYQNKQTKIYQISSILSGKN